jgi:hypothetical protein
MSLALFHLSGVLNFEVVPIFLERLFTPGLMYIPSGNILPGTEEI